MDDYSLNPYQFCDFNCIYCYIRGSKYEGNMKQGLAVKINAPVLLEKELLRRAKRKVVIILKYYCSPYKYNNNRK